MFENRDVEPRKVWTTSALTPSVGENCVFNSNWKWNVSLTLNGVNRPLLMNPGPNLFGNICEDHQVSHEVTNTFLFVANNSRLKRASNIGIFSLCLSCPDASSAKQNTFLGHHVTFTWGHLLTWTFKLASICFDAPGREENNGPSIMLLACLLA